MKTETIIGEGYTANNRVELIRGGKVYFELLIGLIRKAADTIHLQTYIFEHDETGIMVANALIEAAKRRVNVYLLVDGYASQSLPKSFIRKLTEAGVNFRFFETFFRTRHFYLGRRLHHKVAVIDTRHALVGGLNVSNKYNEWGEHTAWLDFALYAEGEIALQLCVLCWKGWKDFPSIMGLTPCEQKPILFNFPEEEKAQIRMRRNDWVRRKTDISKTYIEMFDNAESRIIIMSSYLLPGKLFRHHLRKAAQRGIRVTVITAGRSDVTIAKNAERFWYNWLLRNNIDVYEYSKNILHGKVAVCDGRWLTVGSFNVNNISTYASIELNLDVLDKKLAEEAENTLLGIIQTDCIRITRTSLHKTTNFLSQFVRWASYQIVNLAFYLFTFYFKHQD
ncbi:MAG TPA: phospholipase D-like domain-containing protein [Puia sp.]|nr:phospholipase D-like domain-containing protein [Puia sp.]